MYFRKTDPQSHIFVDGLILWRPVHFQHVGNTIRAYTEGPTFVRTDKGSWMAKVAVGGINFLNENEVITHTIDRRETNGIVLFVPENPPENWTHLIVTGVSKALRVPTTDQTSRGSGGAIFAKVVPPIAMPDYLKFRLDMFYQVKNNLNCEFGQLVNIHNSHWPQGLQRGTFSRCVISYRLGWEEQQQGIRFFYEPLI